MSQLVIRQGHNDFAAFKIGVACLKMGGTLVTVTVNPQMVYDHVQDRQKPIEHGPLVWIVWMTFAEDFNTDDLDAAIEAEDLPMVKLKS